MGFGLTEMLVLLAIVLIFFGAGKLPTVMGDLAKGVRNFKQGLRDEPGPAAPDPDPPVREEVVLLEPPKRPVEGRPPV